LHGDARVAKRADSLAQHRGGGGWTVDDQQRKTVQQQVGCPRRAFRRGKCPGGAGDLGQVGTNGQMPSEQSRLPRVQVSFAGQTGVEWLQPLSRLQQQRRGVAARAGGERDLAAQPIRLGALELIQRPRLRRGQQLQRLTEHTRPQASLRGGQRPTGPPRRIGRQQRGTLQERSRRGQPAARLCAARGTLQLGSHRLVRPRRGLRPMPGPPIGVSLRIGGVG